SKALAAFVRFVYAIAIGDLRHWRNVFGIECVQRIYMPENRVQISDHAGALLCAQLKVSEIGDIADVFFGNFHDKVRSQNEQVRIQKLKIHRYRSSTLLLLPSNF